MTVRRPSFPPFLLLSFHLLAALHTTSDAAVSSHMPAVQCSPSGSYTSASAYAANLNQFLASLPEKTVSKNGGFFNGTVGEGMDTVHGLAMCSAEYSRSDCGDCLAAAANSASGLLNRCPGSTTVVAWFDQCLVRYSDTNFFATAESGIIYAWQCPPTVRKTVQYSDAWANNLGVSVYAAMASPQRFGTSSTDPYMLVQCTWDLPPNLCMQCVQELSANSSLSSVELPVEGKLGSYSCALRYSKTSFPVVPFVGGPTPQYVDQAARSATQSSGASKGAPMPQPQSVDQAAISATQSSGASKGAPMPQSVDQAARSATQSSGVGKGSLAVGVVESVVGLILLACLAALIWHVVKRRSKSKTGHVREFTYGELATATLDFTDSRKLAQGAYGVVYRGAVMMQGKEMDVAIKDNIHGVSDDTMKAFKNEVEIMSPLNHRNIIRLVGWCKTRNKLLLVYELVQNRNLEARLYDHGGTDLVLDWRQRYNILVGIASGLEYLHNNCSKTVMHRDIKPANVMLDMDFNAKLCDFGLVTQLTRAATSRPTNNIIGTQGYMDPLFQQNGQVTPSSDVYSFGVLLLEVVCGVAPMLIGHPPENSLIEHVRECHGRNAILDAAHQRLRGEYDEEIKGALLIGLRCAQARRVDRPTTRIVLSNLVSLTASHVVP